MKRTAKKVTRVTGKAKRYTGKLTEAELKAALVTFGK